MKDASFRRVRKGSLTLLLAASVFTLIGVIAGIVTGLILGLHVNKLTENGGICADCEKNVGELYETLKERIRDKKLEKLELELEL